MKKFLAAFLISSSVLLLLSVSYFLGFFATWQDTLSDKLFKPHPASPEIVIAAIDNKSIAEIGRFPWKRSVYAQFLDKLDSEPAVTAFDITFAESDNGSEDALFASSIKRNGDVVLAAELDGKSAVSPIESLARDAKSGFVNTAADSDGVTRYVYYSPEDLNFAYKHFSEVTAETYLFAQNKGAEYLSQVPLEGENLRVNFAGGPDSYITYSFADILNGEVPASDLAGKIVLVGATAKDLHDETLTPTSGGSMMSGVELQANAIQTLLTRDFILPEKPISTITTMGFFVFLLVFLLTYLGITGGFIVTVAAIIGYIVYAITAFDNGNLKNIVFPILAIVTSFIASLIYKYFSEYRQKQYVKRALSLYLSGAVLHDVLANPNKLRLGGERKEISVLFSDIAGFTSISEKLQAETLAQLLNGYLTKMTEIVFDHKGVLDKYIGDAVMAFWGAPLPDKKHALNACRTAVHMQNAMKDIKKEWAKHGVSDFGIRIGINTGEMVVGNMGSHMRFDYTLLGDNVNLGSRLEGINKEYGTEIIISGSTFKEVAKNIIARKLDTVAVKGKSTGVDIYELRAVDRSPSEIEITFLREFEAARVLYEKGHFGQALKAFRQFKSHYPDDNPTEVYIKRCKFLSKNRPENWDGIFKATSK